MRRIEFRRPILGRLVWGWMGFAVVLIASSFWLAVEQVRKPRIGSIALNFEEQITKLTPPPKRLHLEPPAQALNVTAGGVKSLRYAEASLKADQNDPSKRIVHLSNLAPVEGQNDRSDDIEDSVRVTTRNETSGGPRVGALRRASASGPRSYKVPQSNLPEAADIAAPGELVITIDGRNVDTPKPKKQTLTLGSKILPAVNEPAFEMLKPSPYGKIPRISKNGQISAKFYTQSFTKKNDRPAISFIVGGLGLNEVLTQRAIDELPAEIGLSFVPYGKNLDVWAEKARAKGHEILLEIPMEGYAAHRTAQLGPAALLTSKSPADNLRRLNWILSRAQGYFGVTNYLGSKFSSHGASITPVIEYLSAHGVAYIDDTGAATRDQSQGIVGRDIAHQIFSAKSTSNSEQMINDLKALRDRAGEKGFALGKVAASPDNLDVLVAYLGELYNAQIDLAPASAVLYVEDRY